MVWRASTTLTFRCQKLIDVDGDLGSDRRGSARMLLSAAAPSPSTKEPSDMSSSAYTHGCGLFIDLRSGTSIGGQPS
jgi:hypothetical protein